eukprot:Opistho-2@73627
MDTIGRRSGYLQKQGGNIKSWKRRWFILHIDADGGDDEPMTRSFSPGQLLDQSRRFAVRGATLRYYKGADGSLHEALGVINMADCVVIEDAELALKKPNSFRLVTPTRTYIFIAENRREADEWIGSLTRVVQHLRVGRTGSAMSLATDVSQSFSGTLSSTGDIGASVTRGHGFSPSAVSAMASERIADRESSDVDDSAEEGDDGGVTSSLVAAQAPGAPVDGGGVPIAHSSAPHHAAHGGSFGSDDSSTGHSYGHSTHLPSHPPSHPSSLPPSARSSVALSRDILLQQGGLGSPLLSSQGGIRMSLQRGMDPLVLSPILSGASTPGRPGSISLPQPTVLGSTGADDVRGFLLKKKEGKNWKRRWCVLTGRSLSYFKAEISEVAQGAIDIESGTTVSDADADTRKPNSFKICTGGTTYYFVAETVHDKDLWMNGLQTIARLAASVAELVALSVPGALMSADASIGTLSAENCVVRGQGVESGVVGIESAFVIEARDGAGNLRGGRSDPFVVKINGPFDAARPEARIKNNCDGTYRVAYTCESEGDYVVAITVDGNHVADSPYYAPHDDTGTAGDRRSGSTSSNGSAVSGMGTPGSFMSLPRKLLQERHSVNAKQLHAQHQRDNNASIQRAFLDYLAAP